MTQNLEIEFKNMLTKEEYEQLLQLFKIADDDIFTQENHYFDTANFALKQKGTALRIRSKKQGFEMTLKQPAEIGLLETNQLITAEEANKAISTGKLPAGTILRILVADGIPFDSLEYFGSLITNRIEFPYKQGLLVLDHSIYLNCEDFEMEFEVNDFSKGEDTFNQILRQFGIPARKTENKIRRFYTQKNKKNNPNLK
jgi:uncharacterized protein YjbK